MGPPRGAALSSNVRPTKSFGESHGGPGAGLALLTCPTCRGTKLDPHLFRVVLLRRLQMPLLPTVRSAGVAVHLTLLAITAQGARAGVLGKRGHALESVVARICCEVGGLATNVLVRELDLVPVPAADGRRLEVVIDGLPLHAGVQLAIDTTLVGALRGDGPARRGAADADADGLGRHHFWPAIFYHFWPRPLSAQTTFGAHPLTIHNVKMTFGKKSRSLKPKARDAFTRTRLMPTFGSQPAFLLNIACFFKHESFAGALSALTRNRFVLGFKLSTLSRSE